MGQFLTREANWTEIVTNTLALGFSLMAIVALTYTALFNPDKLPVVSSATSGITGVILGYYFNRERLRVAQRRAERAEREREAARREVEESKEDLAEMDSLVIYFGSMMSYREAETETEEE